MTLNKVVQGNSANRKITPWYGEYKGVEKHIGIEGKARLMRLHVIRIDHEKADEFVIAACKEFDLTLPTMHYTASTDRGRYFPEMFRQEWPYTFLGRHVVRVRPYHLSVWVLCHELTHHWVELRCEDADGWHGWDFTMRLDRLAEFAESWFGEGVG